MWQCRGVATVYVKTHSRTHLKRDYLFYLFPDAMYAKAMLIYLNPILTSDALVPSPPRHPLSILPRTNTAALRPVTEPMWKCLINNIILWHDVIHWITVTSCYKRICQLPLIVIVLLHVDLNNVRCLSHSMCLFQVIMTSHFLNDVVNDIELTRKSIVTSQSLVWTVNW